MQNGQYYSLEQDVDVEITIQRSRFIGSLRKAFNREEFDVKLKEISLLYPKATHYCWAYRFSGSPIIEHSSDSGEPAGSAGRPILGMLKRYFLENTMAVVTRYYGGIKLGVKGLIYAYGEATLEAIESTNIIIDEPQVKFIFEAPYDLYNIILAKLERLDVPQSKMQVDFKEVISGEITVPNSTALSIESELIDLLGTRAEFKLSRIDRESSDR